MMRGFAISTQNFYPRSPRGERHAVTTLAQALYISIHAPREGSDVGMLMLPPNTTLFLSTLPARGATIFVCVDNGCDFDFYPRSPRGERQKRLKMKQRSKRFLSTLPARGATCPSSRPPTKYRYFYPRSPRGERLGVLHHRVGAFLISIHAPREGSDHDGHRAHRGHGLFLSTLPARGATA